MCLGFETQYGIYRFGFEVVRVVCTAGGKLLYLRALDESHIVLVCGHKQIGIDSRGTFDQVEERAFLLLSINNKRAAEYLVPAVFGIDL